MSKTIVRPLIVLAAVIIGLGVLYALTPYYSTHLIWGIRASAFIWAPVLLVLVLGALALVFSDTRDGGGAAFLIFGGAAVIAAIGTVGFWFWCGYAQDKVYAASVIVTADEDNTLPEMGVRTPYSVAQAQSRTTLSNIPGADLILGSTAYDPATHNFTTLATGRDMLGNYSAVAVQNFPVTGRSVGSQCAFEASANKSLGGWFTHSLERAINTERRGVSWSDDDAYGLCAADGTPLVVVPLTRQQGLLIVTEVPAGVAVYNGRDNTVTVHDTVPENITGPVYPMSLAAKQREATDALGGYMQWFRNQIGWDAATGGANDGNNSELVLGEVEGGAVYATPLSLKGTSTGIAAVSTTPADQMIPGTLNPLTVRTLDPTWVSIDAIESRIKADYQDIPNWQTLHVQEIAPVNGNKWVATIGNDQNTLYRVMGTGDLSTYPGVKDESVSTCLFQGSAATPQRCGTLALTNGRGIGTQYGPTDSTPQTPPVAVPAPGAALDALSNAELSALLERIAAEFTKRAGGR